MFLDEVGSLLGIVLLMRFLIVKDHIVMVTPKVVRCFIAFYQLSHPCCIRFGYKMEAISHYQMRILHQEICFCFYVYASFSCVY